MGDAAWRFPRPAGAAARALFERLRAAAGVVDVIVTEEHVAVTFDPSAPAPELEALLAAPFDAAAMAVTTHVIGVRYEGEDLAIVAERAGVSRDELVALHTTPIYEVKTIGFMPGFAYLGDLDDRLVLPRRDTPRVRVPAHAVAIGGRYTAVYPFPSPGGWHLLGRAEDFVPFRFALGDLVRFEAR